MKLSHDDATRDMHKIKQLLAGLGLTDVVVEYPAFLSIMRNGVEYHAGYTFEDDDNDTAEFQVYDFTDGVQGESWTIRTNDNLGDLANTIATVLTA